MKTLFIFFLFVIYMYSNTYGQSTNTKSDIGNSEYAGVYEGNLDVALCCDVYETGFGKIAFVFEGDSVNCLYDGKIIETLMPVNDLVKRKDMLMMAKYIRVQFSDALQKIKMERQHFYIILKNPRNITPAQYLL